MALAESGGAALAVELVHSPEPGQLICIALSVPAGSSLDEALQLPAVREAVPGLDPSVQKIGIWGRVLPLETVLRERDRIEIYRPLTVDPKEARRLRYRSPGDKSKRVRPKPRR